ncbi:hypothetical protein BDA96_10G088400 [Sorghum bicolor]|uniref:Uncharacterized protein n=2 Tax=Sorghum bicolor TaxID=4558 RepID=A0A921Q2N9_SORBI|nr:hypothetical protein BDA96_10G088400 [Sorghum bicolor]OQU76005.1 hypothetical protein SORBI_3010G073432 [Sorghum bicolor]
MVVSVQIWNDDDVNLIEQTNKHQKLLSVYDLNAKRLLLRFNKNILIASCNSHDEQVVLLEDNEVPGNYKDNDCIDSDTYVTRDNNYAMIYSRKHIEKSRQGINIHREFSSIGSINIFNTFNGESVWKINPCDDVDLAIATRKESGNNMTNSRSILHEALQDVTTLLYDEERHIIYTGNKRGLFHVWSN